MERRVWCFGFGDLGCGSYSSLDSEMNQPVRISSFYSTAKVHNLLCFS